MCGTSTDKPVGIHQLERLEGGITIGTLPRAGSGPTGLGPSGFVCHLDDRLFTVKHNPPVTSDHP